MKQKMAATLGFSILMLVVWVGRAFAQEGIRPQKQATPPHYFTVPKVIPSAFAMGDPSWLMQEEAATLPQAPVQGVPLPSLKANPYEAPDDDLACKFTKRNLNPLGGAGLFCVLRVMQ